MTAELEHRPAGALAVRPAQTDWTPDQRAALSSLGIDDTVTAGDLKVYLTFAQRTGLDPFAKQCFLLKFSGKWQAVTARDGLRVIAERTGDYRGTTSAQWCGPDLVWRDVWLDDVPPVAARIGVHRDGFAEPVYRVATWQERARFDRYGKLMPTWRDMPALMLAKVSEADALRAAFPLDLSGVLTVDEMGEPAPLAVPPPPALTLDELLAAAVTAVTLAELQATWREAGRANVLDAEVLDRSTGEILPFRDYMLALHGRLGAEPVEYVIDDAGELVAQTDDNGAGDE